MNWAAATCWALLFAAAFLCDGGSAKGGRGGARGSARGGRGASRVRVRPAPRYSAPGSSLRVAAAGAAAGAAVGLAAGAGWRRAAGPGEHRSEDEEDQMPGGNGTGRSVYSYRAWTSGTAPRLHLCLLLGGALGALELLRP
ncbi:shadow of prion protein [Nycticebus coucang]|uniref:shadow of prion protein n=1 Tax=Nycticebus coucang TaxID=9470 RepID=UPI00234DF4F0|nr:shadow of prion protein [Nycticebus coucang]